MSGPATGESPLVASSSSAPAARVLPGRTTTVGATPVRRTLPQRALRAVGPWCFVDHLGPVEVDGRGLQVGPHPHIGLATVTWLLEGAVLHRDSLGSLQEVRPGQLNLMHAGGGVVHAEEGVRGWSGTLHGVQLWVAQPEETRHGAPSFEHHAELPLVELAGTPATVLVGSLAGTASPARADSPLVGADLSLSGGAAELPLDPGWEHAVVPLDGIVEVDEFEAKPGELVLLPRGRSRALLRGVASRALLLGGAPLAAPLVLWWNFVGRDRGELERAYAGWRDRDPRFPELTGSPLRRLQAPRPSWMPPAG